MKNLRVSVKVLNALSIVAVAVLLGIMTTAVMSGSSAEGNPLSPVEVTPGSAFLPILIRSQPTPAAPGWLSYINQFRDLANLPHLTENGGWSYGGELHSRYMVKEDVISHSENSSSLWYTTEGDQAGRNGNIFVSSFMNTPDESAFNWWMSAPFHAIAIIDPQLQAVGFGSYRENDGGWTMGATLDVSRGLSGVPDGTIFPLSFPRDGGSTWLTEFYGNEWPDPFPSCPGYSAPSGPVILLQLGSGSVRPSVTASTFSMGTTPVPHCLFDETNFTNPDSFQQSTGRLILDSRDAVVILPRDPLLEGQSYTASITTADGNTYTWSFGVVTIAPIGLDSFPADLHAEIR